MPVVALVAVGLVQIGLAVRNQLAVELTAREAAREAAVALDAAGAAQRAASRVTSLPVEVATASDGSTVRVTVTYEDAVAIPLLGALMGPIRHRAVAVMALEPP